MRILIALLVLGVSVPLRAQAPYLVKDINTTYANSTKSSSPDEFASLNGSTFFAATTEASGRELWSTDGTSAGTKLVADIVPGSAGSGPTRLTVVNGVLVFSARDADRGEELWATDGTAAGTGRLADINPGPGSSSLQARFVLGNRMLFSADNGTAGRELWITDGTAGGTRLLRDLSPGSASSSPGFFVSFSGSVWFAAAGGIWKTDGTDAGTVKMLNVMARNLRVVGSRMFFEGADTGTNWELWITDGTEAGTRLVKEIVPGTKGAITPVVSLGPMPFGERVLFVASDDVHGREIWISDGTAAGTRMVRDVVPGSKGAWENSELAFLTVLGNRAYFAAPDAEHGTELWVTDGTEAGTSLFADLRPGTASSWPHSFVATGGKLYGIESATTRLWVTDGTSGGTGFVGQAAGLASSAFLSPVDGKVWFGGRTALTGFEPWVSDGTDAGTRMIANLAADRAASSFPATFTATRDLLFFRAFEGEGAAALWRSDGTEAGTFKLEENGQYSNTLTAAGPYIFFTDRVDNQNIFMMSDGSPKGTRPAADFLQRFNGSAIEWFFPFGDTLFASVASRLWKTTAAPGAPAIELGSWDPRGLIETTAGQYVFYASNSVQDDYGLWRTDGTLAGTWAIVPGFAKHVSANRSVLAFAGGTVYFIQQASNEKPVLWKSDGTFDGTKKVKELPFAGWKPNFAVAGRKVFFESDGAVWVSDGTESGTIELAKVTARPSGEITDFQSVRGRLVFVKKDGTTGYELWASDGTPAGTRLLKKLDGFTTLRSIDGTAWFAGADEQYGTELWTTDGTPEGTKLLIDLNPGPGSSQPTEFTKVRNTLYFNAYTDTTGSELWALPLTEPLLSIDDVRAAEGDSGTTAARFTVSLNPPATQTVTVTWATSDATAHAGADYDAAGGMLTFAPGDTAKTIEVRVRGDISVESDETFIVTLHSTNGARVVKADGAGIVTDDDLTADLDIAPLFSPSSGIGINDAVSVSNAGPGSATNIAVTVTTTPAYVQVRCAAPACAIPQLGAGASAVTAFGYGPPFQQQYLSATASARQRDPQPSNNATSWTINGNRTLLMDKTHLTTGATATITASLFESAPAIQSSDPSVVAVPSAITKLSAEHGTFTVTALKPGTSMIQVGTFQQYPLLVTVVAPGTAPRWPGALTIDGFLGEVRFDEQFSLRVALSGQAPLTGASPTGTIVITSAGQELARRTIAGTGEQAIPFHLRSLSSNALRIAYSGDATFLAQNEDRTIFVRKGEVSMTGALERKPDGTHSLTVRATGSPVAPPTGTVAFLLGTTELARVSLTPSGNGTSTAQATLAGLPGTPTVTVQYPGDAFYNAGSQQFRAPRSRGVRH